MPIATANTCTHMTMQVGGDGAGQPQQQRQQQQMAQCHQQQQQQQQEQQQQEQEQQEHQGTTSGCRLFVEQARSYAQYRPRYPQAAFDIVLQHLGLDQRNLAVDVATGSGQAAIQLAECGFTQVLATDGSEEQLRHAQAAPRGVAYAHADAHSIPLPDASADLVCAASAIHWFDQERFYRECRRVLKPHGVLMALAIPLGLATMEVPAAPAGAAAAAAAAGVQQALHFIHEEALGACWDARKRLCDDLYKDVRPSLHHFMLVLQRQLAMPVTLSVEQLVGYASSWSAYTIYRKRHPDAPDPLLEYRRRLVDALEGAGLCAADAVVVAHIPVVLLLAQGPKPLATANGAAQ